jgi:Erv1 / Alr family
MNQNLWGPAYWFTFHTITFQYPFQPTMEEKRAYGLFFEQLKYLLPCKYCRQHYQQNWNEIPIQLENRRALVEWLVKFHNQVNLITGKPVMSLDQVIYWYETYFGHKILLDEPITGEKEKEEDSLHKKKTISESKLFPMFKVSCISRDTFWFYVSILLFLLLLISFYYSKKFTK